MHTDLARGLQIVGHTSLNGKGDGGQVIVRQARHEGQSRRVAYVAHMGTTGTALSVVDVSNLAGPVVVDQLPMSTPWTHSHKVQILGDLLLMNLEAFGSGGDYEAGLAFFSLANPLHPDRISSFPVGGPGAHRMWLEGARLHVAAGVGEERDKAYWILDLREPMRPAVLGRWRIPDDWRAAMRHPDRKYEVHHVIAAGDRAYAACWDAGMVILDIADPGTPRVVSRLDWSPPFGGATHTVLPLPGRPYVVVADEALPGVPGGAEGKLMWVVDVRDESNPVPIATCPVPHDPIRPDGLYGPHNFHENYAGSFISDTVVFAAAYSYGLRVYSLVDPNRPAEIAACVPRVDGGAAPCLLNDLYVDANGVVFATDRVRGGLYVMMPDEPWPRPGSQA